MSECNTTGNDLGKIPEGDLRLPAIISRLDPNHETLKTCSVLDIWVVRIDMGLFFRGFSWKSRWSSLVGDLSHETTWSGGHL